MIEVMPLSRNLISLSFQVNASFAYSNLSVLLLLPVGWFTGTGDITASLLLTWLHIMKSKEFDPELVPLSSIASLSAHVIDTIVAEEAWKPYGKLVSFRQYKDDESLLAFGFALATIQVSMLQSLSSLMQLDS